MTPDEQQQAVESFYSAIQQTASKEFENFSDQTKQELITGVMSSWGTISPGGGIRQPTQETFKKVPDFAKRLIALYSSKDIPEDNMAVESERIFEEMFAPELIEQQQVDQQVMEAIRPTLEESLMSVEAQLASFSEGNRNFIQSRPEVIPHIHDLAAKHPDIPMDIIVDLERRQEEKRQYWAGLKSI